MIPRYTGYQTRNVKSGIKRAPLSHLVPHISFPGWWALGTLAVYLLLGAWATTVFGLVAPDVAARTGTGAAILWSRNPHYGALLTAWPPLTTALQLPLVWLLGVLFNAPQFSANVLSALASTAGMGLLYKLFGVLGLQGRLRWLLIAFYATNPVILLYAVSGSSTSLLISCLLLAIYGLAVWWGTGRPSYVGLSGLGVTAAFLVNYWSLLFALVVATAFLYGLNRRGMAHPWARLTLFIMPIFYTLLFWLAFNFISMQDPFAFMRSSLHSSFTELPRPSAGSLPVDAINNLGSALVYGLFVAFVLFICLQKRSDTGTRATSAVWIVLLLAANLAAAGLALWPAQSFTQPGSTSAGEMAGLPLNLAEEQAVGDYLRREVPADALILLDQGDTYSIIDRAGYPERFVIPSDVDYREIVGNAEGGVDYILVWNSGSGQPSAIQHAFPMLYGDRWPYAQLEHDFGGQMGWRLFRVTRTRNTGSPPGQK